MMEKKKTGSDRLQKQYYWDGGGELSVEVEKE
jgi:hypothetical protein